MALYLVRSGKYGESEDFALDNSQAVINWKSIGDLRAYATRDEMLEGLRKAYPDEAPKTLVNWLAQLWMFSNTIQVGDLVAMPLKSRSAVAIGEVLGDYRYESSNAEDARHTRPVRWIMADVPRSSIDQDLLYSLGAFMTVCQIKRNNAEQRIRALVHGKPVPSVAPADAGSLGDDDVSVNLDEFARDQIRTRLAQKFKGHELSRLVGAILNAQGYFARVSPPGADGGVDVIAARGPMGFDSPRVVVQVKSQDAPVDVVVLRELQGVMKNFGAEQGLLVAWGGFKSSVIKESARQFFELRLWDADDLISALTEYYDQLPEDIQSEIPLKRIWVMVTEG